MLYLDDEEKGLSPDTSHPRFVAVTEEDFWYDCTDDFSPFGNDAGSDTLSSLEEWLTEHGAEANVADFVREMLSEQWDMDENYLTIVNADDIRQLYGSQHQNFNDSQDQAVIAAALGQFKTAGETGVEIREMAMQAFQRQRIIAEIAGADESNPLRVWVPQYLERLEIMRSVLQKWT